MKIFTSLAAVSTLAIAGCQNADNKASEAPVIAKGAPSSQSMNRIESAQTLMAETYDLRNASGAKIGAVTIRDTKSGVDVMLDATSIPKGMHAIHFHENGVCDGPGFQSAGGHYNPLEVAHGQTGDGPHAGDMPNFDAPQSGVVTEKIINERVTLSKRQGFAPLLDKNGTALIIHAAADDYKSQPSGAAGARIACAVIAP